MNLVNRAAVVIRFREPYLRWAASVFADSPDDAEELRTGVSVYLVPEDPAGEDESAPLEEFYEAIFAEELAAWCQDESRWPKEHDYATFRAWFDVQVTSVVTDLGSEPLASENLDEETDA